MSWFSLQQPPIYLVEALPVARVVAGNEKPISIPPSVPPLFLEKLLFHGGRGERNERGYL